MDNKTPFESKFGISLSTGSAAIEKAVEMGIQIEREGQKFYREKAAMARIPYVRHHLDRLAKDEQQHESMLTELKKSLTERGEWIGAKETPDIRERIKQLAAFKPDNEKSIKIKEDAGTMEVLNEALKLEARVRDFFKGLSEEIQDEKGREFFSSLARWEQSHYDFIKAILHTAMDVSGMLG